MGHNNLSAVHVAVGIIVLIDDKQARVRGHFVMQIDKIIWILCQKDKIVFSGIAKVDFIGLAGSAGLGGRHDLMTGLLETPH
jgi:hypothetical protein